jgi:hypothetical protein
MNSDVSNSDVSNSDVSSSDDDAELRASINSPSSSPLRKAYQAQDAPSPSRPNEDAFSSSSSDGSSSPSSYDDDEAPSEWDKALLSGKPSKGQATEFFSNDVTDVVLEPEGSSILSDKSEPLEASPPIYPPPPPTSPKGSTIISVHTNSDHYPTSMVRPHPADHEDLSAGVLPDVLMNMRLNLESLALFDSDMMRIADGQSEGDFGARESLKRSSQQSISAAVLVSLAHKRYERRRLAAMEIEKVVRGLVLSGELERVRAILLLLSDDYVRSTSEDARKGGVVALAACAIGLKKATERESVLECRDLILASVVHACQDHSQRVRYYATESLFNVVKVIPTMAVQHFFILFEILRSLYADVDVDVRSGAELLDKKLKEVIVAAMNMGSFQAEECIPVFARFVYMRNKATKRLTLTWLQELNEKLFAAPILGFLHLFLGGIFDMIADPTLVIRQSALAFLHSVLPKLLVVDHEDADFDKILQSLVTTMEHPDPFVRKVAMYWMSRIVRAHIEPSTIPVNPDGSIVTTKLTAASISVRNSLPHILPGILLSIGDDFHTRATGRVAAKDTFLPDQTTRALAEQTNTTLQNAVRRDGNAYVQHLDGFIVALREELDSPNNRTGTHTHHHPPASVERTPYRMDVANDGTGIESPGWFNLSSGDNERTGDLVMSRLCALDWVIVLYESVVPVLIKADVSNNCRRDAIVSYTLCKSMPWNSFFRLYINS